MPTSSRPRCRSSESAAAATAGCRLMGVRSPGVSLEAANRDHARRLEGDHHAVAGDPMAALLDTSAVVAAADTADLNHEAAVAWLERVGEPLLLGALSLAEVDHVLAREIGPRATLALLESLSSGAIRLVSPTEADLARAAELLVEAEEHRPRLIEALLVATAERLGVRRVATFDRRPIAIFRPRHVRALDLEP
jgi:uncharacterized protein